MIHRELEELAGKASEIILKEKGKILVVSHFDADGICAGSLAYKALDAIGKKFDIMFVKQLEIDILKDVSKHDADLFWFTDLGSGQIRNINEQIKGKTIIISDHHNIDEDDIADGKADNNNNSKNKNNIIHINPHFFGIDGNDEISGAGITYLVASSLSETVDDFIYLALVGATGDVQKKHGSFKSLNSKILEKTIGLGKIKMQKGLRLFGRTSKPLHRCLQYCNEPKIPDVTKNEMGAIKFLQNLNIPPKQENGDWTTLANLSIEQETALSTAIILAGNVRSNKDFLVGNIYMLPNNFEIREFATMLNACGRLGKSEEGMKLCLGMRDSIDDILTGYRRKIAKYLSWASKNEDALIKTDIAEYLIAKDKIDENFIGTIISIRSYSDRDKSILVGFASSENGTKVSGRVSRNLEGKINIGDAIKSASADVGGEGGGHTLAGGAKIPNDSEERFIKLLDNLLKEQLNNQSS